MIEENLEEYMDYYKKLPLRKKQKIALNQLKMLSQMTNKMCNELNINNEIIMTQELIEVSKENYTEDEYSEALIVLINSIQNSLCDFDIKLTELLENGEL